MYRYMKKFTPLALSHELDCEVEAAMFSREQHDTQHSPEKLTHFYMSRIRSELICKDDDDKRNTKISAISYIRALCINW